MIDKKELKTRYLMPKEKLRSIRRANEISTIKIAKTIGISREQYEKKEAGKYPFQDYEMIIIANMFSKKVEEIFF